MNIPFPKKSRFHTLLDLLLNKIVIDRLVSCAVESHEEVWMVLHLYYGIVRCYIKDRVPQRLNQLKY